MPQAEGCRRAVCGQPSRTVRGGRGWKPGLRSPAPLPDPTSRRLPASARASLPLPGAADTWRCYDFRCQGVFATFDVCITRAPFFMLSIGRGGASQTRRLILLISVGWVPPDLGPSGACLTLGSSILYQPRNAAEGDTTPGLRLCRCTLVNLAELNASAWCVRSRAVLV